MDHIEIDVAQIFRFGCVGQLVGALRACGEEQQVPGRHPSLPFRGFQDTLTAEDVKSFFGFVVVVVRIGGLPRRDLVDADQGILRPAEGDELPAEVFVTLMFALVADGNIVYVAVFDFVHGKHLTG